MMIKKILPLLLAGMLSTQVSADDREELLTLKNTTLNLIEALVQEGILSKERAGQLVEHAELKAAETTKQAEAKEAQGNKRVVRVPYVPDFVRDEIKEQVRAELREDVVSAVMGQAKQERWGIPDALPAWIQRFKFSGDVRLRAQGDLFATDNQALSYFDWQAVNDNGGVTNAGVDAYLNTTNDRERMRLRMRLGVDAKIDNGLKASLRLSTGNETDPVSTNQTLGTTGNRYRVVLDRAYLKYNYYNPDGYPTMTLWGGRIPNPWLSSDLVWDSDLGFEGVAGTLRTSLAGGSSLLDIEDDTRSLSLTVGAFPLQEEERFSDKWLFGGQLLTDWIFSDQSRLRFGIAYYDYYNTEAQPNTLGSTVNDWTAPGFIQKGNSLVRISNDVGEVSGNPRLVGLASEFEIISVTGSYDLARFSPTHAIITADYAKNIGFDRSEILQRTGIDIEEQNEAYGIKLTVGWPKMRKRRDWQLFAAWKHIERDSVFDAFTDSDFHLGGTDAEGWIIGGSYGLTENTWLKVRWISADEIDGPPLGIDILQIDLNARF